MRTLILHILLGYVRNFLWFLIGEPFLAKKKLGESFSWFLIADLFFDLFRTKKYFVKFFCGSLLVTLFSIFFRKLVFLIGDPFFTILFFVLIATPLHGLPWRADYDLMLTFRPSALYMIETR